MVLLSCVKFLFFNFQCLFVFFLVALTQCQLEGVPAALVVCYSDSSQSTMECVSAFQPVLGHAIFSENLIIKASF